MSRTSFYVASSWRNPLQPGIVQALRDAGHKVYDFKASGDGYTPGAATTGGFHWSEVDPEYKEWTPVKFRTHVQSSALAQAGFRRDMDALRDCQVCVLVLPCGSSAHIEAGFAVGAGKPLLILLPEDTCHPDENAVLSAEQNAVLFKPELMYLMASGNGGAICTSLAEMMARIQQCVTTKGGWDSSARCGLCGITMREQTIRDGEIGNWLIPWINEYGINSHVRCPDCCGLFAALGASLLPSDTDMPLLPEEKL